MLFKSITPFVVAGVSGRRQDVITTSLFFLEVVASKKGQPYKNCPVSTQQIDLVPNSF